MGPSRAAVGGVALLIVQSIFGGITVIYQLPDLVSTTHLSLAFSFLALTTLLSTYSHAPTAGPMAPGLVHRCWNTMSANSVNLAASGICRSN